MTQSELIAQTQAELRRHGFSIPSTAAVMDADTTNAIIAYQSANGLPQTGLPSAQLLATLRADNRMVSQPIPPVQTFPQGQPIYPSGYSATVPPVQTFPQAPSTTPSYSVMAPPAQPVQCADFFHQNLPGGSDYSGPPVPGCR
jgi:peptidoglycan hydrolase-like protein with peptidoglycan-binding domain